jgi:hypothetical protein
VFQLSKPVKKTRDPGIVNTRGGGGEAWTWFISCFLACTVYMLISSWLLI